MNNNEARGLLRSDDGGRIDNRTEYRIQADEYRERVLGRWREMDRENEEHGQSFTYYTIPELQPFGQEFRREYMAEWVGEPERLDVNEHTIHRRVDACSLMMDQITSYQEKFGRDPKYISLDRVAYESFYIQIRNQVAQYNEEYMSEQVFMAATVIMNPLQRLHAMALGSPQDEMMGRSLYAE